MADNAPINEAEQKPAGRSKLVMIIAIVLTLVIEGVVVYFVGKSSQPAPAEATEVIEETTERESEKYGEIELVSDFSVDNNRKGRVRTIVKLDVFARIELATVETTQLFVTDHNMEIRDAIRTCIASAEPANFEEPDKKTLKRQMKSSIEKIVGDGTINEIYITKWSKMDMN